MNDRNQTPVISKHVDEKPKFDLGLGGNNLEELDELLGIMTDRAFEETE